ncbi:hypothetical protein Pfo_015711 [Paulownia fortunei]|nr:hypothetical protein Pfo_015711 [Paulownia fortunei]
MAYSALVSLAQTIDHILNRDQYFISLHEKQQIRSLHEHVVFLQLFLEDFPGKANSLERRIRDVAKEAEDIIECLLSEHIMSRYRLIKSTVGPTKIEFKHQLKKVTKEIDAIAGEVMDIKNSFRIKNVQLGDSPAATSSSRLASTSQKDMVGFDDDLIAIKARLCGESSKLQVIPIFGMGGIGKTTLARNAYDDPLIVEYFHIRVWIAVSQDYSAQEILSGLLVSLKELNAERFGQSNESMAEGSRQSNDSIAEDVYRSLKGMRYLIVMDDMWSTKAWDDVKMIFPDDHNGSRVMLTTRLLDVATYADSCSPIYEMRFMDEDQSWNLLRQKVFKHQNCPPELEDIGKEIARSCRGLPLAIVVIAGLLSTVSKTRASWEEIARNINSAIATKDGQFAKILSLSYTHLPHHLRPCFLYMGGFREDYEIRVSKLIKLWVAEGFLKPSVPKSCEEAAEEYLEDLVKRSLVLVTKRKTNGKIKICSVHDLVRDLCIRKAKEEKFLLLVLDRYVLQESIKNQRRVSIAHSDLTCPENIYGSTIRTIICFQQNEGSLGSLGNFRLLRVLDVVNGDFSLFGYEVSLWPPDQLFELFHLRYLAFRNAMWIPAAISNLQNLQILIIHSDIVFLPLEIWRLPQLRHLFTSSGHLPNPEKGSTSALENLQTLSAVTNLICSERILNMIPNLKKLGIIYSGNENDEDYHLNNLVYLHQLEKLKLSMYAGYHFRLSYINLAFPRRLKRLTLSGLRLPWKDMTIVGSLPNLQVLKLRNYACDGDKNKTSILYVPEKGLLYMTISWIHASMKIFLNSF